MTRPLLLSSLLLAFAISLNAKPPVSFESPNGYVSPYTLHFTQSESARTAGWDVAPWNNPLQWGIRPHDRWYDCAAYRLKSFENLAYGMHPIHFPPPPEGMSAALKRERVLTAAQRLFGMRYQHHHIPTFDPYPTHPDWPWIKVANGIHGPGLDCSNFVAWVYNYALGIRLSGAVGQASRQTVVGGPGKAAIHIQSFEKDPNMPYAEFVSKLRPGDVLYIRGKNGARITHSILWVGTLATDSNGRDKYFIIDSTGPEVRDSNGTTIPDGAHIRPFRENSWYFHSAAIVHRIIQDEN